MMYAKILKPWFIYNPALIARALLHRVGIVRRGWVTVNTCFGAPILCDTSKAIGRAIYRNGVYELPTSELVWRMLEGSPAVVFVDVGANVGYFSVLASNRLGVDGAVIAFEPRPDLYPKLLHNLNGRNVRAYQYAVSSVNGHSTLLAPEGSESNDGLATLQQISDAVDRYTVQTICLDEFLDREVFILKIDIEGHELHALVGARSLLSRQMIKNIIFEDHDVERSEVVATLVGFGYTVYSIGWTFGRFTLKPLGETSGHFLSDAPNFIATLDDEQLASVAAASGWKVLRGI